jgi:hypothetical protein
MLWYFIYRFIEDGIALKDTKMVHPRMQLYTDLFVGNWLELDVHNSTHVFSLSILKGYE